jgi:hypothetical protein
MLALDKCSGHQDLRGSGRRSIIPYDYGRMRIILFTSWLFLSVALSGLKRTCLVLMSTQSFYSSRLASYNETQGLTCGPGAGKTICYRVLMTRSSK